jgi:hypothetical protein
LVPAYLQRIVGGSITGLRVTGFVWVRLGVPFEMALAAFLVVLVAAGALWGNRRTRAVVPVMVATSLAIFLFSGYQRWFSGGRLFLWPAGSSWSYGSHYMIVPTLLLLSAIVVQLDARPKRVSVRGWNRTRVAVVSLIGLTALLNFNVSGPSRGTPTWLAAVQTGRTRCARLALDTTQVLIAPNDIGPTYMQVPCHTLIGSRAAAFPTRYALIVRPPGATRLSGRASLLARVSDGAHVVNVLFMLQASEGYAIPVAKASRTPAGWSASLNTKGILNGRYEMQAVATYQGGDQKWSPAVTVDVKN